eukprot:tig00020610_g11990.t1
MTTIRARRVVHLRAVRRVDAGGRGNAWMQLRRKAAAHLREGAIRRRFRPAAFPLAELPPYINDVIAKHLVSVTADARAFAGVNKEFRECVMQATKEFAVILDAVEPGDVDEARAELEANETGLDDENRRHLLEAKSVREAAAELAECDARAVKIHVYDSSVPLLERRIYVPEGGEPKREAARLLGQVVDALPRGVQSICLDFPLLEARSAYFAYESVAARIAARTGAGLRELLVCGKNRAAAFFEFGPDAVFMHPGLHSLFGEVDARHLDKALAAAPGLRLVHSLDLRPAAGEALDALLDLLEGRLATGSLRCRAIFLPRDVNADQIPRLLACVAALAPSRVEVRVGALTAAWRAWAAVPGLVSCIKRLTISKPYRAEASVAEVLDLAALVAASGKLERLTFVELRLGLPGLGMLTAAEAKAMQRMHDVLRTLRAGATFALVLEENRTAGGIKRPRVSASALVRLANLPGLQCAFDFSGLDVFNYYDGRERGAIKSALASIATGVRPAYICERGNVNW